MLSDADINRINEFKTYLDNSFTNDLDQGASTTTSNTRGAGFEASKVLDNDSSTYWAASDGVTNASLTLDLGSMKYFDMIELQEPIELGLRITGYNLEAWNGSEWVSLGSRQGIGIKHIVQFPPITASKVRLNITSARACPTIRTMKIFKENGAGQPAPQGEDKCIGGTITASSENPPNEDMTKAFDNDSNTNMYRLNFSDNNGDNDTQLAKIEMFGD